MRADTRIEPQSPGVERPRRMPDGGASNAGGGKTELQGFPERNPSAVFPVLSTENCFIWSHRAVKRNGADVLKKRVLRHIFIKEKTIAGIRRAAFPACSCGKRSRRREQGPRPAEESAHFFNSANISICHETFRSSVQSVFANCFIDIC